ncbi:MAG: hypothetical protein ACFHU9_05425 [Fluviicola sp.]
MKNLKKNYVKVLAITCLALIISSKSAIAQSLNSDSSGQYLIGINAFVWKSNPNATFINIGGSLFRTTKKKWLNLYASGNYVEYNYLAGFGGFNISGSLEFGTGFSLRMGRKFSSTLLTGIGYHRVHIFTSDRDVSQNAAAIFGSVDVSYRHKNCEYGLLLGSSLGRGNVTTYFDNGNIDQETLFSYLPKLGIQFKYKF